MKKDIKIPKVEGVGVAIVSELEEGEEVHNSYLVNFNKHKITNVLISTKGYGVKDSNDVKTATFRHFKGDVGPLSYVKIEPLTEELLGLNNEFFVTYYIDRLIYDKKYIFLPEAILKSNFIEIGILEKNGVLIK